MDTAVNAKTAADATSWHALTVDEVLKRLSTSTGKGLRNHARRRQGGPHERRPGRIRHLRLNAVTEVRFWNLNISTIAVKSTIKAM
jgi:hypothetical protein